MKWLQEMLQGFEERICNIAVFKPILDLNQRTKYRYPLAPLGLASMLFILEDMLRGEKDCTYEKLAYFLRDLIHRQYNDSLTYDEALEFTYYLVREGLMNQGRPHAFSYPDLAVGVEKTHKFHLIELEDYDIKDKTVRLKLSTVGLELLFKTKEMYNELQVSIAQLYLRQQIQRGVFDGALRSVEELSLAVKNQKNKILQIEEKIIRDVLLVAREQEIEKLMERVNEQLEREKKVFGELEELIEHTMREYHSGNLTEKEEQAVAKIMKIKRKLLDVIHQHEALFTEKLRIQQLMSNSVEAMILNAFSTRVNFETEFLRPVVQKNLDISILKKILDPLLPVKYPLFYHPGRVFLEQPLKRLREEDLSEQELWEMEEVFLRQEEEEERQLQLKREQRLKAYLLLLLTPLVRQQEIAISDILENLQKNKKEFYQELTGELSFYPFLIQLHQLGVIPLLASWEMEPIVLDELPRVLVEIVQEHRPIHDLKGFELVATDQIIQLPNGYVMSDFIVRRRTQDGMA